MVHCVVPRQALFSRCWCLQTPCSNFGLRWLSPPEMSSAHRVYPHGIHAYSCICDRLTKIPAVADSHQREDHGDPPFARFDLSPSDGGLSARGFLKWVPVTPATPFRSPVFVPVPLCFLTPCCLLLRRCPAPFVLFACLRLCLVSVLSFTVVHFVICCCPLLPAAFLGRPLLAAVTWSVAVSCPPAASAAIRAMPSHASVVVVPCCLCHSASPSRYIPACQCSDDEPLDGFTLPQHSLFHVVL